MTTIIDDITIRIATIDDLLPLRQCCIDTNIEKWSFLYSVELLTHYLEVTFNSNVIMNSLMNSKHRWYIVINKDNKIIGYAQGKECTLPVKTLVDGQGEIGKFYIVSDYRNKGIGSKLIKTIISWLEETYGNTMYVSVSSVNPDALRMYERFGFSKCDEYMFIVKEQQDLEYIFKRVIKD